jgi:predicted MFS family arabinose efflux permease
MGMRFTSMSVLISEAVPSARGTMNAVNSTFFNMGLLVGSFAGGLIVDSIGFPGLVLLVVLGHAASMLILSVFLVERRDAVDLSDELVPSPARPLVPTEAPAPD